MATRPPRDYFVTRTPDPVPADPPPVIDPSCTCFIASGQDRLDGINLRPAQGHRDEKGRPICQVHFPVDKAEWESRAMGGLDDIPRL